MQLLRAAAVSAAKERRPSVCSGLTLTRSHRAVVAELPWTATALFQAIKRVHRIGTTRTCTADVLQAPGCWLDEAMATVVEGKRRAADDLMDRLTSDS
jgi:hypothetical protein